MLLEWQTASETDSSSFHIWRRDNQSGEYRRVTASLIPATRSTTSGASCTYEDRDTVAGKSYTYFLEEVDGSSTSTLYQQDNGSTWGLRGDANGDGKLDLSAVLYVLQVLSGVR